MGHIRFMDGEKKILMGTFLIWWDKFLNGKRNERPITIFTRIRQMFDMQGNIFKPPGTICPENILTKHETFWKSKSSEPP